MTFDISLPSKSILFIKISCINHISKFKNKVQQTSKLIEERKVMRKFDLALKTKNTRWQRNIYYLSEHLRISTCSIHLTPRRMQTHTNTHTHMHTRMHARAHTNTYTHTYRFETNTVSERTVTETPISPNIRLLLLCSINVQQECKFLFKVIMTVCTCCTLSVHHTLFHD